MQRGHGGEKKRSVRPQRRKSRVGYCEPHDDSDQYANESADTDVGSKYQLSDLDEHDCIGFEELEELFSAEEDKISEGGKEGEEGVEGIEEPGHVSQAEPVVSAEECVEGGGGH